MFKKESFVDGTNLLMEEKSKDVFEEIILLKSKIEEIEEKTSKKKEEEMIEFKRKFASLKSQDATYIQNIQYDLCYACLFGNNIVI